MNPGRIVSGPAISDEAYLSYAKKGIERGKKRYEDKTIQRYDQVFREMEDFLQRTPKHLDRTMENAVPLDILVFMEGHYILTHGRTTLPNGEVVPAYDTVKGVFTGLRKGFINLGRTGEWSDEELTGNPRQSNLCGDWLAGYKRELLQWGYEACAAYPLTDEKRKLLIDYIDEKRRVLIDAGDLLGAARLEEDALVYCYLWDSIQRGTEGARLHFEQVGKPIPDEPPSAEPSWIKNRKRPRCGSIELPEGGDYDLWERLPAWKRTLTSLGRPVTGKNPVFPAVERGAGGRFTGDAMTGDTLYSRLVTHLKGAELYEGESTHSFRRGGVQALVDAGVPLTVVADRMLVSTLPVVKAYNDRKRPTRYKPRGQTAAI
jgi:hypothetical protein